MKPPMALDAGKIAGTPDQPAAVLLCAEPEAILPVPVPQGMSTLLNRPDFLKAAQARRQSGGSFLLQARDRRDASPGIRIGFTASKKIGNAVARNRAKRRLREIARKLLPSHGRPGWDYVLVARPEATISRPFEALLADLELALQTLHKARPA